MQKVRNRLLITLVLIAVAMLCVGSIAEARARSVRQTQATARVDQFSKPGATPASGEPDAGSSPPPSQTLPRMGVQPVQGDVEAPPAVLPEAGWLLWISRIWAVQYLGSAL